ncbi:DCL protein [Trifolium repens]|nr:DCL protein [Trifolium repens]
MASSLSSSTNQFHSFKNPFTFRSSRFILSIPFYSTTTPLLHSRFSFSLKASSSSSEADKPILSQGKGIVEEKSYCYAEEEDSAEDEEEEEEDKWVDWEDQILEDTVPLVGFVRMILHSGLYEDGVRLNPEHEETILEKLLPFHPESEKKIGCGVDYITVYLSFPLLLSQTACALFRSQKAFPDITCF